MAVTTDYKIGDFVKLNPDEWINRHIINQYGFEWTGLITEEPCPRGGVQVKVLGSDGFVHTFSIGQLLKVN